MTTDRPTRWIDDDDDDDGGHHNTPDSSESGEIDRRGIVNNVLSSYLDLDGLVCSDGFPCAYKKGDNFEAKVHGWRSEKFWGTENNQPFSPLDEVLFTSQVDDDGTAIEFWPTLLDFENMIAAEMKWRSKFTGNWLNPVLNAEVAWRFKLYKGWLKFLDEGLGPGFDERPTNEPVGPPPKELGTTEEATLEKGLLMDFDQKLSGRLREWNGKIDECPSKMVEQQHLNRRYFLVRQNLLSESGVILLSLNCIGGGLCVSSKS